MYQGLRLVDETQLPLLHLNLIKNLISRKLFKEIKYIVVLGMGFSPYPSVANAGITNYFPIQSIIIIIINQVRAW